MDEEDSVFLRSKTGCATKAVVGQRYLQRSSSEKLELPHIHATVELLRGCEEVPVFLKRNVADISGLQPPSLRSLFWIGGIRNPLHPYLANGLLVSIDRRRQKPIDSRSLPLWQQTIYTVLKRDGTYLCGPCGTEDGMLVMHPDAEHIKLREQFRNRRDAEVVGQITAVVRRL